MSNTPRHILLLSLTFAWFLVLDDHCCGVESPLGGKHVSSSDARPLNVLFIAVDDLRPVLGCYGDKTAVTPNLDRLASRGTVFERAYCQQALCSPSRLSLLTGRRPDTTRVWDLSTHFRQALPSVVTLPQHFKNHGYQTQGIGKILHGNGKPAFDPPSWSFDPLLAVSRDPKLRYASAKNLTGSGLKRESTEAVDVADDTYIDGKVCEAAIERLAELKTADKPFFLAVGFRKPHLPFCAPKKYWDLYERNLIPAAAPDVHPINAPELATRSWRELEGYQDIPNDGKISAAKTRQLRHGYYACVSYIDSLIGRLLKHLSKLQLTENTVVVVWGDHGFHLGEQGLWTKANNYELSTRVPLIMALPNPSSNHPHLPPQQRGTTCHKLVELTDIFPTLVDICRLPTPIGLEGSSFSGLLKDPNQPWKSAVFSQHPRDEKGNRHKSHGTIMGYSVRTDRYRYVEWKVWDTGKIIASELYDHHSEALETKNSIEDPDYAEARLRLHRILAAGWKSAGPPSNEP